MKRPALSPRHQQLVAKSAHTGLTPDEQEELATAAGVRVRDLPLSMRGGLMGVFGFTEKQNG